jgi:F0F1-type ATP synthase membrane subunit b/b'
MTYKIVNLPLFMAYYNLFSDSASSVKDITNKVRVNEAELLNDQSVDDVLQKLEKYKEELAEAKLKYKDIVERLKKG